MASSHDDGQGKLRQSDKQSEVGAELARKTLALVLAGGEGSRLKGLTSWRAKPAVPFGGKYRVIDFVMSNCVNSGVHRIGVLTQYKAHSLIRHLQHAWGFMRDELNEFVEILPAQQRTEKKEWYQGTADALFQNLDIVRCHNPEYIIVLGGDHVYRMDYSKMLAQHVASGADFTVGCIEMPRSEASDFGVMAVDERMRITHFVEKPADPPAMPDKPDTALVSMGIYVFSRQFLFDVLCEDAKKEQSSHDFGRDIIPNQIRQSRALAYPFRKPGGGPAYWRDVGTLYSYWQANMELCCENPEFDLYDRDWPFWTYQPQYPPVKFIADENNHWGAIVESLVSSGCVLSGTQVKKSVVSFATTIEGNSLIQNSVILPKVSIGHNCRINYAIIDKGCIIPDGAVIGEDREQDRKRFHISPEGIVLVTPEMLGQQLHTGDQEMLWRFRS